MGRDLVYLGAEINKGARVNEDAKVGVSLTSAPKVAKVGKI